MIICEKMIKYNFWIKHLSVHITLKYVKLKEKQTQLCSFKGLDWKEKWFNKMINACAFEYSNPIGTVIRSKMTRRTLYDGVPVTSLALQPHYLQPWQKSHKGVMIISISQRRKVILREGQLLSQGHTGGMIQASLNQLPLRPNHRIFLYKTLAGLEILLTSNE